MWLIRLGAVAFIAVFTLWLALAAAGCRGYVASRIVDAQTPGSATGAGATLTGPHNSGTPSEQIAERSFGFAVPALAVPQPAVPVVNLDLPARAPLALPVVASQPTWVTERVQTKIGAHQDAAGIIAQAAKFAEGFTKVQWLGIVAIVVGVGGLLWSAGHNEGYPLVFWKSIAAGVLLVMFGDNPWWLAVAAFPFLLYAAQKVGIIRVP